MLKIVADRDIPAAALRSVGGASNALLREAAYRHVTLLLTAPLFFEYETHLKEAEQRLAHGRLTEAIDRYMSAIASVGQAVITDCRWHPMLTDPVDELVLEAAVVGKADAIVAHQPRRFTAADRFGIKVFTPRELLKDL